MQPRTRARRTTADIQVEPEVSREPQRRRKTHVQRQEQHSDEGKGTCIAQNDDAVTAPSEFWANHVKQFFEDKWNCDD